MNEEQARLLANDLTRTGLPATAFRPVDAPPGEYYIEVLGADGRYRVLKTVQESEALLERSWNALEQNEELRKPFKTDHRWARQMSAQPRWRKASWISARRS
jgi:hypothetical protein